MSVIKNNRKESTMQFLDNMKKIHSETLSFCIKCPKRWDGFLTHDICHLSTMALVHVKNANSIYPTNQGERQMRKNEFTKSLSCLQSLITLMDNLFDYCKSGKTESFKIKDSSMERWMLMYDEEIRLIKGIMKKDTEKYKNLPGEFAPKENK